MENTGIILFDINPSNNVLDVSESNGNKNKNKQMRPN